MHGCLRRSWLLLWSITIKLNKTSLKIFKHYKLKPSFPIIKDEKDKVGVGDKPPTTQVSTVWSSLIQFDQVWANLIQFDQVWANLNQFVQVWSIWSSLIQFILLYSYFIKFDHVWSNLIQFDTILSCFNQIINLMQFQAIWTNFMNLNFQKWDATMTNA